jgi:hypothetical protein
MNEKFKYEYTQNDVVAQHFIAGRVLRHNQWYWDWIDRE